MASSSSTRTASATGCDGGRAGLIRALRGLYGIAGAEPGPGGRGAPLPLHDSDRAPPETAAGILGQVEAYVAGGARAVQLRVKPGVMGDGELLDLCVQATARCRNAGVLLLVNDRADLAALAGADGVHVGWDDLPPAAAREIVGPDRLVGVSAHDVGELRRALQEGADYVGYGPVYASVTKAGVRAPRGLDALAAAVAIAAQARAPGGGGVPVVAIGGITDPDRAVAALRAGAAAAAVLSGVCRASDPASAARRFSDSLAAAAAGTAT